MACLCVIRVTRIKVMSRRDHTTSETQSFRNTDKRIFGGWAKRLVNKKNILLLCPFTSMPLYGTFVLKECKTKINK